MANLARYTQRIFGLAAGFQEMAEYGSFAFGAPMLYDGTTITPAIVQTLGNYGSGWFSAVEGDYSPAIEDLNSLCYLFSYQLTYLLQAGIPYYDAGTTYNKGSIVQFEVDIANFGVIYRCIDDGVTGIAPNADPTKWSAPLVPDGFNVGVSPKAGTVVSQISNTSPTNPTDAVELSLRTKDSTLSGNSFLTLLKQRNGVSHLSNDDPMSTFNINLNVNGAGVNPVMQALNSGKVNFPIGLLLNNTPVINQIITRVITSNQNYTPTAGTRYCLVEVVGGGGGSGAADASGSPAYVGVASGGGGAGGYCKKLFEISTLTPFVPISLTIGAGGAGGTFANGLSGLPGGQSLFGTLMNSTGGLGSLPGAGSLGAVTYVFRPGAGGVALGGDIDAGGNPGNLGVAVTLSSGTSTDAVGGAGGGSIFGGGGNPANQSGGGGNGGNAEAYGAGGGGAAANGSNFFHGGNGAAGVIIITEFISS